MAEKHTHEAKCWTSYDPCGELLTHTHTHDCGNGVLGPGCPEYKVDQAQRAKNDVADAIRLVSKIKKRVTSKFVKHDVAEALDWLRRAEVAAEDDVTKERTDLRNQG